MAERAQIDNALNHLSGSEQIIGNIVAYCVNAHKADPSAQTMDKIRQYVSDTANSVCGHVLTIAHNINAIIDKEVREIDEISSHLSYAQHRLKAHQTYMSQLYMTKFQTLPRPKPTINILRETIPNEELPKYARPRKPWVRNQNFNYSVLDNVGSTAKSTATSAKSIGGEGDAELTKMASKRDVGNTIQPKIAAPALNPYDADEPTSPKTLLPGDAPSLYQQAKLSSKKASTRNLGLGDAPPSFSAAPPSFSAAPPSFSGAAPPAFSQASSNPVKPPKPPQPPSNVNGGPGAPPPVPPPAPQ
eukprot:CAMPEP_0202713240 /NCGR_PEP_ID=MMETSP1385-20130828/52292_1 /ASSEMBLY_ACC=CAM_ASM_000861 /TAXON_ID=933848 /ORGANISM="Elphidium margaritaceum" /LENGTH=301 /DNA_ID=CAMNT_0049373529 /DNA_START=34 /DNA_END=939 /DNA_ORIENTATION=+